MFSISLILGNVFVMPLPMLLVVFSASIVCFVMPGHLLFSTILPDLIGQDVESKKLPVGIWAIPVASISIISILGFFLAIAGILNQNVILIIASIGGLATILLSPSTGTDTIFSTLGVNFSYKFNLAEYARPSAIPVIFALSLLLGSATIFVEMTTNEEPWVEFYVYSDDNKVDSIPSDWPTSEPLELHIGIVNHGVSEELVVLKKVQFFEESKSSEIVEFYIPMTELVGGEIILEDNTIFNKEGQYLISYELLRGDGEYPFRTLQLWINSSD